MRRPLIQGRGGGGANRKAVPTFRAPVQTWRAGVTAWRLGGRGPGTSDGLAHEEFRTDGEPDYPVTHTAAGGEPEVARSRDVQGSRSGGFGSVA